jgi:2-dehydropantoate 2-reductase
VMLAMKSQDTPPALEALYEVAPPDIAVACVQNGVANERAALRYFENVHAVCVMCPTSYTEPGVVEAYSHPTSGILDTGRYPSGVDYTTVAITTALEASRFVALPRPDVMRWKYGKLLMNLGNGIDALCGPGARGAGVYRRLRAEAEEVFRTAGIDYVGHEEDLERRGDIMKITPIEGAVRGGGSTWQSLARGLPSVETDYLNGEIVLIGRLHGVPTPANEAMQRLMRRAARERWEAGSVAPENVEELMFASV